MATRMKEHVANPAAVPLLIFPEGTCVNNEYCVLFKRGAFDLGATVCPVAIKCVPRRPRLARAPCASPQRRAPRAGRFLEAWVPAAAAAVSVATH